jgi:hypothetical protein
VHLLEEFEKTKTVILKCKVEIWRFKKKIIFWDFFGNLANLGHLKIVIKALCRCRLGCVFFFFFSLGKNGKNGKKCWTQ